MHFNLCLVFYNCVHEGCSWKDFDENIDWGHYSKVDGDCGNCKGLCNNDTNCGAVECGKTYCSWWKVERCSNSTEQLSASVMMCRKTKGNELLF